MEGAALAPLDVPYTLACFRATRRLIRFFGVGSDYQIRRVRM